MEKREKHLQRSSWQLAAARFARNKLAMAGVVLLGIMILAVLLAPLYMSYSDMIHEDVFNKLRSPCAEHPLGTDEFGRDLLARILYGGRISLFGGIATIAIAFVAGCIIGGAAGYFGGRTDTLLMRLIDMLMAIPPVLLAMAILTALGNGLVNLIISLAISQIPRLKIIARHILPNGIGPIVVSATLTLGQIILSISSMGFLGLGVASPTPEWGTIISENMLNIRYYPYLGIAPAACICLAVMAVNFIGDGLRDAFDPRN